MKRPKPSRPGLWAAIGVSVIALGVGVYRLAGLSGVAPETPAAPPLAPTGRSSTGVIVNLPGGGAGSSLETSTWAAVTPTLALTLIGPRTPADGWANALLDRVLPLFEAGLQAGDGLAWWQSATARSFLDYYDPNAYAYGGPVALGAVSRLIVSIPNSAHANQLIAVGQIDQEGSALILTAFSAEAGGDRRWILADADFTLPIKALAIQAAARSMRLTVALNDPGEASLPAVLVALGAERMVAGPLATASPRPPANPATPSTQPRPTATRAPDVGLGRMVAAKLDGVIDALGATPAESMSAYLSQHSPPSPLAWTENGPTVSGRLVGIGQATSLTIEALPLEGPLGVAVPFLAAVFEDGATRLLDEGARFQGHRMEEILYWMVYRAAERRGTLVIVYDDFGARQTIGVVGFVPFSQP